MHFCSMTARPVSSYSCLETHIWWNDPSDARIEPPIHVAKRRSTGRAGAVTLYLYCRAAHAYSGAGAHSRRQCLSNASGGARGRHTEAAVCAISLPMRSTKPDMSVLPPVTMVEPRSVLRRSASHCAMALLSNVCTPSSSPPGPAPCTGLTPLWGRVTTLRATRAPARRGVRHTHRLRRGAARGGGGMDGHGGLRALTRLTS